MKVLSKAQNQQRTLIMDEICPDCGHPKEHHMNLVGCCYPVGKHPDSEGFKGAVERCYCERLNGFIQDSMHKEQQEEKDE